MDAEIAFRQKSRAWIDAAQHAWRAACNAALADKTTAPSMPGSLSVPSGQSGNGLTLLDDTVMDRAVVIGRLAAAITDQAGETLVELRIRVRGLEHSRTAAFSSGEIFRPEIFAKVLVDAWLECDLTLAQWALMQDTVQRHVAQELRAAYERANAFLLEHGATPDIDLRTLVRRAPGSAAPDGRLPGAGGGVVSAPGGLMAGAGGSFPVTSPGNLVYVPPGSPGRAQYESAMVYGVPPAGGMPMGNVMGGGMPSAGAGVPVAGVGGLVYAPPGSVGRAGYDAAMYGGVAAGSGGPVIAGGVPGVVAGGGAGSSVGVASDSGAMAGHAGTVIMSVPVPLAMGFTPVMLQQRAQDVLTQLRTFTTQHAGVALAEGKGAQPVSPVLALALAEPAQPLFPETEYLSHAQRGQAAEPEVDATQIDQVAEKLKDKAEALKDKAERPDEKATIEIVSLMFQAILADEHMPAVLRVWFGRLQVPVLRVALAEPEFFAATDHPARRLIDRLGACAMGLDNTEVDGGRLEREVKRIVQVIEQYPETGKKVFQIVLDEFEKFLGNSLAEGKPAQQFATLAQQIEQKDALTIQYTIELRKMLSAVPVGNEVREFLFRVWSEVLALAAVRYGAQAAETMRFKQAAADLLWVVSPKASRAERQQVMQCLPGILQTLREGMAALAMRVDEQDSHIHLLNRALTQTFNTAGQGIASEQMNALARALAGLEDVVTDDPEGDLLLDPALLEQILGVESENLHVISAGGARPDAGTLQWADELQRGDWFVLHYLGVAARVQYVWRSERGQLHLFAALSGTSYLVQTRRLAAYLQAGLLVPLENEALTIRAMRETLDKLGEAPERLLA